MVESNLMIFIQDNTSLYAKNVEFNTCAYFVEMKKILFHENQEKLVKHEYLNYSSSSRRFSGTTSSSSPYSSRSS